MKWTVALFAGFGALISCEAAVPARVAITVVRHEVSRSAPFAEGKQPNEFPPLDFVMREKTLLFLLYLRLLRFFGHLTIPPSLQALLEEHS